MEALVKADPPLIQEAWYRLQGKGQEVRSWTDYILGTDLCLFRNVTVWDPRHNSDYYMVLGCLPRTPLSDTKQ